MNGIIIKWNKTPDYDNIQASDFQYVNQEFAWPITDPNFDPASASLGVNEEMLICTNVKNESDKDCRVYQAVIQRIPTNTKNAIFGNVNEFQTSTRYVFKSLAELKEAIKQRELEANMKVQQEASYAKLLPMYIPISSKVAANLPLTEKEQCIYNRGKEVEQRTTDNDSNARALIEIATLNEGISDSEKVFFNINDGWSEDNITPLDIPFNEL